MVARTIDYISEKPEYARSGHIEMDRERMRYRKNYPHAVVGISADTVLPDAQLKRKQGIADNHKTALIVKYDTSFSAAVNSVDTQIFEMYLENLKSCIMQETIEVSSVEISTADEARLYADITFTIHVNAPSSTALPFWKRIDMCIDRWLENQSKHVMETVLVQFSTAVHWK